LFDWIRINGKRYFQAKQGHGSLVRPDKIEVGDFEEVDILKQLEELEEM
jgi:tubulin-specific chaperone B